MFKSYIKSYAKYFKVLLALLIIIFIVIYIKDNLKSIGKTHVNLNFGLLLSFILILVYYFNLTLLWYLITGLNNCSINLKESVLTKTTAALGKYVPGKFIGYAILFNKYSNKNISKIRITHSLFIELIVSFISAVLFFLIAVLFSKVPQLNNYKSFAIVVLIMLTILIHPKIYGNIVHLISYIIKRNLHNEPIEFKKNALLTILYFMNLGIFGLALILFIRSFYSISFEHYLYITGTTVAAGALGLFAIFVPAGLGVREGILVFTLSFVMPPAMAGIIALSSRIWMTFAEIFLFGVIFFLYKANFKKNQSETDYFAHGE